MKSTISPDSGYRLIVSEKIPKLSTSYIKSKVVDKDVWSDLFTNRAKEKLKTALFMHLCGLGANVSDQVMNKFAITDEVVAACKKKYPAY